MNEKFIRAFDNLDVNNKRDKLNRELMTIGKYLEIIEKKLDFDNTVDIYNYDVDNDKNMTEGDFLTSTYQDVFNVERELITIIKLLSESEMDRMFNTEE